MRFAFAQEFFSCFRTSSKTISPFPARADFQALKKKYNSLKGMGERTPYEQLHIDVTSNMTSELVKPSLLEKFPKHCSKHFVGAFFIHKISGMILLEINKKFRTEIFITEKLEKTEDAEIFGYCDKTFNSDENYRVRNRCHITKKTQSSTNFL